MLLALATVLLTNISVKRNYFKEILNVFLKYLWAIMHLIDRFKILTKRFTQIFSQHLYYYSLTPWLLFSLF